MAGPDIWWTTPYRILYRTTDSDGSDGLYYLILELYLFLDPGYLTLEFKLINR